MAPEGHIRVGALEAGLAMFRIDKNPRHFHWHNDVNSFYDDHFWLYMTAAVCYLPLAFGVQRFLRDRKAVNVPSWMLFAWNGFWSVFSGLCFFDILRIVVASDFTWNHSICTDEEFLGELANRPIAQVAMRARFLFIIAKLAELGDTVFIVLRKRPLIVLHYWHHETVMVFCWQLVYVLPRGGDGTYYALMNSFVHMVMYGYYAVTVYWKAIRKVPGLPLTITVLQITQMIFGIVLLIYRTQHCSWHKHDIAFAWTIYSTYLFLFVKYFVDRYYAGCSPAPVDVDMAKSVKDTRKAKKVQ